jgi:hypothetical protein
MKMEALSDSTGFLGYMILKQIGVCALGSFMLDPGSIHHVFSTNDGRTWLEVLFAIMKKKHISPNTASCAQNFGQRL